MSDSDDSTVTYTKVSSPFEGLSDIGSPGVIVHGYNGLPWMLEDPYVEAAIQETPPPDFIPEPVYPEFMPPENEVFPAEEQPLPAAVSPTADSPRYIVDSDMEEDEEDLEEDPEEDLTDYPAEGGDDGDDEDELSDDDEDDDDDDHAPSAEETEPFETDESATTPPPHPAYRVTARMSIRPQTPISLPSREEVDRLFALPSPPPLPLSPLSSPLPQIPSPPLPVSPPLPISPPPLPASPTYLLGYRAVMIRLRAEAVCLPPWKRLCFAFSPRFKVGESSSAPTERDVGYKITDTWDKMLVDMAGEPATDETELGRRMTNFVTTVRQDIDKIYVRLDDAQSERQLVTSQVNMLRRDRRAHACTARLMEAEAKLSREAWVRSIDASDLARSEVMALHTQVLAQWSEIIELQAADRRRQTQLTETLKLVKTLQTQMTSL
ncbi:hypothetical protein Tco_0417388 [Tanacetum coccineum]